jgi:hypothetical protein
VFHHQRRDDAAPRRPEKDLAPHRRAGVATLMSRYCACCATAATARHDSDERGDIACAAARVTVVDVLRSTPLRRDVRTQGLRWLPAGAVALRTAKRNRYEQNAPWRLFQLCLWRRTGFRCACDGAAQHAPQSTRLPQGRWSAGTVGVPCASSV